MRLGDATKCKWSAIANDLQTVTFIPEKKRRYGVAVTLPIVGALRSHLENLPRSGEYLTPQLAKASKNSVNFGKLLNLAGISDERPTETGKASKPKRLRSFHSLRHTVLTELAKSGADKQIRMLLADHDDAAKRRNKRLFDFGETKERLLFTMAGLDLPQSRSGGRQTARTFPTK